MGERKKNNQEVFFYLFTCCSIYLESNLKFSVWLQFTRGTFFCVCVCVCGGVIYLELNFSIWVFVDIWTCFVFEIFLVRESIPWDDCRTAALLCAISLCLTIHKT